MARATTAAAARRPPLLLLLAVAAAAAAAADADANWQLEWLGTYDARNVNKDAAEKVAYDPIFQNMIITNAFEGKLDVVSIRDPTQPLKLDEIDVLGALRGQGVDGHSVQGVSASADVIVAAVYAANEQDKGVLALFDATTLELIEAVPAGYQPDSCNVSPDRRFIACANKGSTFWGDHCPDHNLDGPECDLAKADLPASITVLEMDPNDPKKVLNFGTYEIPPDRFDADDLLLNNFVRLYGPSARYPHLDLSPADAVISEDNVVYVNFQDNNAVGAFSIADRDTPGGGWKWVQGYGFPKFTGDLAADGEVAIKSEWGDGVGVRYIAMPDKIDVFVHDGRTFLVTANEGTSRDYEGKGKFSWSGRTTETGGNDDFNVAEDAEKDEHTEVVRLGQEINTTCASNDALVAEIGGARFTKAYPARLDESGRLLCDSLFVMGGRGFSIFEVTADGITPLYDAASVGELERVVAAKTPPEFFNSDDDESTFDATSPKRGMETEVAEAAIMPDGTPLVFVGAEKQSGIFVYDVSDPSKPKFQDYLNRRNWGSDIAAQEEEEEMANNNGTATGGKSRALDVGPESIVYVSPSESPICAPTLLVANPLSGTTSVYKVARSPTERPTDGSCSSAEECAAQYDPEERVQAFAKSISECSAASPEDASCDAGACELCVNCIAQYCEGEACENNKPYYANTHCNRVCAIDGDTQKCLACS